MKSHSRLWWLKFPCPFASPSAGTADPCCSHVSLLSHMWPCAWINSSLSILQSKIQIRAVSAKSEVRGSPLQKWRCRTHPRQILRRSLWFCHADLSRLRTLWACLSTGRDSLWFCAFLAQLALHAFPHPWRGLLVVQTERRSKERERMCVNISQHLKSRVRGDLCVHAWRQSSL